jgi:DNA polymerase I
VILDSNYLMHRSKYALQDLSTRGIKTGIIFGFLNSLLKFADTFHTNRFIFTFDSKRSVRKDIYPDYKGSRNNVDAEAQRVNGVAFPQFTVIRKEILPKIGFRNIFHAVGYEADDIIAKIVQNIDMKYIVVSRDNDLYQLLDYCDMYDPEKKKVFSKLDFQEQHRIEPSQWSKVKSIAGCDTDNIKGVYGVGESTACKYLTGKLSQTSKAYRSIVAEKDTIAFNEKLVTLPFDGTPSFTLQEETLSLKGFLDVCGTFDLYSFAVKRLEQWRINFNLR